MSTGQRPRGYPTSEDRGRGRKCQAVMVQKRQKELPESEFSGGDQKELPRRGRGDDREGHPASRLGVAAGRSHAPLPQARVTAGRSKPSPEARGGG